MAKFGEKFLSGLGGALSGVAGGFIGSAGSKMIDGLFGSDPNKQNKEIMQMQNQFNAQEAQKNRDFQLQMFNRTNEYNSPKAQMQRFMEAGLNPDLMYGNGASSIAAQSPSGSQASGSSPIAAVDMQQRAANVALTQAQTRLAEHQADNLDADSGNKRADTAIKLKYNEYQDGILQGQIETAHATVFNLNALRNLTKQQQLTEYENTKLVKREFDLLGYEMENLEAETRNLDTDTYKKEIDAFLATPLAVATIKRFAAQNTLDYAKAKETLELLMLRKEDLEASINLKDQTAGYFYWNGKNLEIDYLVSSGQDKESFRYDERKAAKDAQTVAAYGRTAVDLLDEFTDWYYGGIDETTTTNWDRGTETRRRTSRRVHRRR